MQEFCVSAKAWWFFFCKYHYNTNAIQKKKDNNTFKKIYFTSFSNTNELLISQPVSLWMGAYVNFWKSGTLEQISKGEKQQQKDSFKTNYHNTLNTGEHLAYLKP